MTQKSAGRRRLTPVLAALASAAALLAVPGLAHADPGRTAQIGTGQPVTPVTGGVPLINSDEPVGPGIDLQHVKALDKAGWYDAQFLTVDLSKQGVSADLLTSGPVASGGPLSQAANQAGAVAGVNGEFFDIGNSNAALGGEIQNGKLLKTADIGGREHVGVSQNGIAQLVDLTVNAAATFGGSDHAVLSINAANGGGVPTGGLVAYTSVWGSYSRNRAFTGVATDKIAEVLMQNGKVVSVTANGPAGSGTIPDDGFVLVGRVLPRPRSARCNPAIRFR